MTNSDKLFLDLIFSFYRAIQDVEKLATLLGVDSQKQEGDFLR